MNTAPLWIFYFFLEKHYNSIRSSIIDKQAKLVLV